MRTVFAALCAQWLVDGVHVVDCRELVGENVGPRVAPLLRGGLNLRDLLNGNKA